MSALVVLLAVLTAAGSRAVARCWYGPRVAARLAAERLEERQFWAWVDVMRTPS